MKCCFASDLHGHPSHYEDLLNLAKTEKADAVILGGDLLPRKGHHLASLEHQQTFVREEFRNFSLRLAEITGVSLYAILGNDDWAGTVPLFHEMESEGLIRMLDDRPTILQDRAILTGYSYVPPTPFLLKDFEKRDMKDDPGPNGLRRIYITRNGRVEETDEKAYFEGRASIQEDLLAGWKPSPDRPSIRVMHGPPFGTALDRLYDGRSAGSRAVRECILKTQPLLTLHGHIHESPAVSGAFVERIGETLSVNAGQTGNGLSAVTFDPDRLDKTLKHTLYGFSPLTA
jgi:Icc-related predicted phosphoesterase